MHLLSKALYRRALRLTCLSLIAALPAAHSNILEDWQFNEPSGTPLTSVANSAPGGTTWSSNVGNSFTTGDGIYRIQRNIAAGNQYAHAFFWNVVPVMWLVFDFEGWAFSTKEGGYNEELRFGFSENDDAAQYAEILLGRTASPNQVYIKGLAELRSGGASWVAPVPAGFSNVEERPVRVILKLDRSSGDPNEHHYSIYYNIDGAGHVYVGTGSIDAGRNPNYIRVRALNSFNDLLDPEDPASPREFVNINRIFVTSEDPVGTDIIPTPEPPVPEAKLVHDWRFEETAGTPLIDTVDSVAGNPWLAYTLNPNDNLGTSVTTGDGAVRVRRAVGENANLMAYIERIWTGKQWFVVDFRGWNLTGVASDQIRMGFLDQHQVSPTTYAEFQLRRWTEAAAPAHITNPDPDIAYFSGQIFGATNGAQGIPDEPTFPANQTEPVRIVLEIDEDEKTYAIYYRFGNGEYELLGESTTDFTLGPNALRFSVLNNLADEDDYVDVERVFLTRINPMLPVEGGYAGWADENFPGGGADADPGADPDGDGIENLLEYAFGGNPNAADRSVLPATMMGDENQAGQAYLQIQFSRNPDADDLTYTVKASDDLVNWTAIASASNGGPFVASGASSIEVDGNTVTIGDSEPAAGLNASATRRFLQVDVTLATP